MKWKKILIYVLLIAIFLIGLYLILQYIAYKGYFPKEEVNSRFQDYSIIGSIITTVILVSAYFIYKFIENKGDGTKFKEMVKLTDAEAIVRECFIQGTKMPHYYDRSEDRNGVIKTEHPDDLNLYYDSQDYTHPITGKHIWKVEIHSRTGTHKGISTLQIDLDLGKEYIRNNWFKFLKRKTITTTLPYEEKKYPFDTPESQNDRLAIKKFEYLEENATEKELAKEIEKLRQQPTPLDKREQLKTPEEEELKEETQRIQNTLNLKKAQK